MSDLPLGQTLGRSGLHGSGDPGIPTPPNPGKIPPPRLPPGPEPIDVPVEDPDTDPTGPGTPNPDLPFDEPPDPTSVPDRLPGHPTGPGVRT